MKKETEDGKKRRITEKDKHLLTLPGIEDTGRHFLIGYVTDFRSLRNAANSVIYHKELGIDLEDGIKGLKQVMDMLFQEIE